MSHIQIENQMIVQSILKEGVRQDGRDFQEFRPTSINVNSLSNADGSAIVRLGKTVVVCGVKAELAKPKAETPNEGYLIVNVELPPLCSPSCLPGPPGDEAQAATSLLDRALNSTKAIDLTTLCIVPDRLCWVLYLDIVCLNLDGSLIAAAICAASAALQNTSLPQIDFNVETGVKSVKRDVRTPLPTSCTPFAATFAFIEGTVLSDPTAEEEILASGLVTAVVCPSSDTAVPLFMPGSSPVSSDDLLKCVGAAKHRARNLEQLLRAVKSSPER